MVNPDSEIIYRGLTLEEVMFLIEIDIDPDDVVVLRREANLLVIMAGDKPYFISM